MILAVVALERSRIDPAMEQDEHDVDRLSELEKRMPELEERKTWVD